MKVFEGTPKNDWGEKVNFIDENNVFVGYDMGQSCCEHAEWFVADEIKRKMPCEKDRSNSEGLESYRFDPEFFEQPTYLEYEDMDGNALDSGEMAVFRMTDGENEKFLHLFNCHNGYYDHGFTMKIGDEMKREGYL